MLRQIYKLVRIRTKFDAYRWALAITAAAVVFALLFFYALHDSFLHLPIVSAVVITAILIAAPTSYWGCIQILLIYKLGRSLKTQVEVDALTRVNTRRFLFDTQFRLLEENHTEFVLLMVDIDHFKSINDTYNHMIGDAVLQHVASVMTKACRATDVVCRFGGEEFAVVLSNCDYETGFMIAERVRTSIAFSSFMTDGKKIPVTVSIGIAKGNGLTASPENTLRLADDALYEAKRTGRNRVVASDVDSSEGEQPIEVLIPAMVASDETIKQLEFVVPHIQQQADGSYQAKFQGIVFGTAFQPILDIESNGSQSITGLEALIRANHNGISVTPLELFSKFTGEIRYQLECICIQLHIQNFAKLQSHGKKLFLNVNLGILPNTEQLGNFVEFVAYSLITNDVAPQKAVLEIVEADIQYPEQLADFAGASKYHRMAIAIDDFGSGSTDLNRCTQISPSIIKIDGGLFHRSMENKALFWLLRQLLVRFQQEGVEIVIEGVEDEGQQEAAISLGGKMLQGYHLAIPLLPPYNFPDGLEHSEVELEEIPFQAKTGT